MESLADKIARLETKIAENEGKRDQLKPIDELYAERELAFTREIATDKEERMFLIRQQGKFASPISVVLFHSYR